MTLAIILDDIEIESKDPSDFPYFVTCLPHP